MSASDLTEVYAEIAQIVARYAKEDAIESPIDGLFIVKRSSPTQPLHAHQRPSFWLVAQGRKCVKLGDDELHYGVGDCLLVALDMPMTSRITHATEEEPHLCVGVEINPTRLAELMGRLPAEAAAPIEGIRGVAVTKAAPALLDATLRLLRLLDRPQDVAALVPLIEQEILYHLLSGPCGARLLHITLYSPLRHWNAGPGKKVAILGMGGLGHMGVKLAHAMGADVTVLSQTLSKQADGLKMGADHYYATNDPKTFETLADTFDLLICTVSSPLDWGAYLSLLKIDGTMVIVGAPEEPVPLNAFALIPGRRTLAGSMIGSIKETQEMLDFCGEHNIVADIEVIAIDQINEAYKRMAKSDVRYRFVIDMATL